MRTAPQFLSKENRPLGLVCLLLAFITVACYWPITRNGFVLFDDPRYIYQNPHVKAGLTWAGVAWAFTTGYASNWHPLTWISHMLDCQIFGISPGGHHFTNLLLHAINSVLLFLLLRQMTGAFWRSAFVAALFAWHPLHVESVAWAAERKDVLSTLFFLLTLWAYHKYCTPPVSIRAPASWTAPVLWRFITPPATDTPSTVAALPAKSGRGLPQSKTFGVASRWYLLALLLFSLGLMSKPMLVTLPCVLLLLDFWPLNRLRTAAQGNAGVSPAGSGGVSPPSQHRYFPDGLWPLVREKIPFFLLSFAASVVTFLVQRGGGAVSSLVTVPFSLRVSNALLAYVRYISKTLVPVDLSVFYPLPEHWPILAVAGAGLLLLVWSILFFRWSGRYPYLLVGWLWFLGTLVPTIGLVQVGSQSMADRYIYIPSIGLFLMIAWGAYDAFGSSRRLTDEYGTCATVSLRAFSLSPSEGERAGERG
ncbi:MAG TPA: hypothetical protein VG146_18565, partial [Verrucomicrobiae bacterium]|nr:hypothetical protein [Verrucomicrobiae bacterium]